MWRNKMQCHSEKWESKILRSLLSEGSIDLEQICTMESIPLVLFPINYYSKMTFHPGLNSFVGDFAKLLGNFWYKCASFYKYNKTNCIFLKSTPQNLIQIFTCLLQGYFSSEHIACREKGTSALLVGM